MKHIIISDYLMNQTPILSIDKEKSISASSSFGYFGTILFV